MDRPSVALGFLPRSKVVPALPAHPVERRFIARQRSKAEGYLRDRDARKQRQQRQVLVLGASVVTLGLVLYFVLFTFSVSDEYLHTT